MQKAKKGKHNSEVQITVVRSQSISFVAICTIGQRVAAYNALRVVRLPSLYDSVCCEIMNIDTNKSQLCSPYDASRVGEFAVQHYCGRMRLVISIQCLQDCLVNNFDTI